MKSFVIHFNANSPQNAAAWINIACKYYDLFFGNVSAVL